MTAHDEAVSTSPAREKRDLRPEVVQSSQASFKTWGPKGAVRGVLGLIFGCMVGAVVAMTHSSWLSAAWASALVLTVPSSSRFDRRVAINLSAVLALAPVLLWVPPIWGPQTAVVAGLSLGTGVACANSLRNHDWLPKVRLRDGFILLAALLAGLATSPMRAPANVQAAIRMLSTGIDNSSHFAMYLEQRLTAADSPLVSAHADSSGFAFSGYPQWYHKTLTVLAQVAFGDVGSSTTELIRYTQLQWFIFSLLATALAASFLQALPERIRTSFLLPALAILTSLLLGVPGMLNLTYGHLSYLVAACAPLLIFLLAWARSPAPVGVYPIFLGLAVVSASWPPLLPLTAAALIGPVSALWRRTPFTRRTGFGVACLIGGAGMLFLASHREETHNALVAILRDGAVPRVGLPATMAVLGGSMVLLVTLAAKNRTNALGLHLAMILSSTVTLLLLGVYMLWASGSLTYYFWKLGLGSLLVSIIVSTHAVLITRGSESSDAPSRRFQTITAAAVSVSAAAGLGSVLQEEAAPSMLWALVAPSFLAQRSISTEAGDVDVPLRLAASMDARHAARVRLLATRAEDMNPAHASAWFHTLSYSATRDAMSMDDGVYKLALDRGDINLGVALARSTLASSDGQVIVTSSALYQAVLDAVPPSGRTRVILLR